LGNGRRFHWNNDFTGRIFLLEGNFHAQAILHFWFRNHKDDGIPARLEASQEEWKEVSLEQNSAGTLILLEGPLVETISSGTKSYGNEFEWNKSSKRM
jgi:hypothetical protein